VGRFSNILFVADANSWSPEAYGRALKFAVADNARLTVLDIIQELPRPLRAGGASAPPELWSDAILARTERLKQLIGERIAVSHLQIHVVYGRRYDQVIHEVTREAYDLVICRRSQG
jgi:hypothetical protein